MNLLKRTQRDVIVKGFDKNFITQHPEDYENYAALYSHNITDFADWDASRYGPPHIEVLLKISNCCRTVYRKGIAYSAPKLSSAEIMLGYRSKKLLGVSDGNSVSVKRTSWFTYLWHHNNSSIRYPFRVAIVFGLLSLAIGIASLYFTICPL